jgi:hypothetical protein
MLCEISHLKSLDTTNQKGSSIFSNLAHEKQHFHSLEKHIVYLTAYHKKYLNMRAYNNIEIILVSTQASRKVGQKALVKWLTTTLQSVIDTQQQSIEKIFLKILQDSPAIYLS